MISGEMPDAKIYVFGNCNVRTSEISQEKKPRLLKKKQGEGYVIVSMISKAEADLYVLVDGDDTYPAESVHALMQSLLEKSRYEHWSPSRPW